MGRHVGLSRASALFNMPSTCRNSSQRLLFPIAKYPFLDSPDERQTQPFVTRTEFGYTTGLFLTSSSLLVLCHCRAPISHPIRSNPFPKLRKP